MENAREILRETLAELFSGDASIRLPKLKSRRLAEF